MKNDFDFIIYYSDLWLKECIDQNNCKNETELFNKTLINKNTKDESV
tara:strand:+ start:1767 stop:1907 length:141 start_codon:yes stop_codon:yes gene_type:complete